MRLGGHGIGLPRELQHMFDARLSFFFVVADQRHALSPLHGGVLSFRVGSTLVRTNASTQFKDTSCAALKAGDSVEVKGSRQADAAVVATRVEKRK